MDKNSLKWALFVCMDYEPIYSHGIQKHWNSVMDGPVCSHGVGIRMKYPIQVVVYLHIKWMFVRIARIETHRK